MSTGSKQHRYVRATLFTAQAVLAGLLIAASSIVMLLWLILLTLSYVRGGGLMPWIGAGIILYGLFFVGLAAVPGIPGIVLANRLSNSAPLKWRKVAKLPEWFGGSLLAFGLAVAVGVLVREQFRPRDPYDGCISYRNEAASAALSYAGPGKEIDCPVRR